MRDAALLALLAALVALALGQCASAHQDPAACTGAEVGINLLVNPPAQAVRECEPVSVESTLEWLGGCLLSGGDLVIKTEDGPVASAPVGCLGDATVIAEGCAPGQDNSAFIPPTTYFPTARDIARGFILFTVESKDVVNHSTSGNLPILRQQSAAVPIVPCPVNAGSCTWVDCDFDEIDGIASCQPTDVTATFPECGDCGDGVVTGTEECDLGLEGNGARGSCCDRRCRLRASDFVCRPSIGDCDVDDHCDGASPTCGPDRIAARGDVCRPIADGVAGCDLVETCSGVSVDCPEDVVAAPGEPCDVAGNRCDETLGCVVICGNGQVDDGEACDPADERTGHGCRPNCTEQACGAIDPTFVSDEREQCDDGDIEAGDGCDELCRIECANDGDCPAPGNCVRPLCVDGRCATEVGCSGDRCETPLEGLDEGSVTLARLTCLFERPIGGTPCAGNQRRKRKLLLRLNRLLGEPGSPFAVRAGKLAVTCNGASATKRTVRLLANLRSKVTRLRISLARAQLESACEREIDQATGGLSDMARLIELLQEAPERACVPE